MTTAFTGAFKLFTATLFGLVLSTAEARTMHPLVIYGEDDRVEVYEDTDPARQILAESVVAIMDGRNLRIEGGYRVTIEGKIYGEVNDLCTFERFFEQTETADCSGFLVAENVVATAGHCVTDRNFCKDSRFVFNYMLNRKSRNPNTVTTDDVYSCRQILHDEVLRTGSDYALIELDRPVVGREPLRFASSPVGPGDSVFIIGHPSGLPAKVATGARVTKNLPAYFVADLDAFSGNSGAAVFNEYYEVAGVLVRGGTDFVDKGTCRVANRCSVSGLCSGEDVSNAEPIAEKLAELQKISKISSISRASR